MSNTVKAFVKENFRHFNAATLVAASEAYDVHLRSGGKMFMAIAGAMSTAELGISLAEMIRKDKVHAISCTGANLEEDIFNSALKLFLYKKGLIVKQDTDTYTFQKVTFSIMVRGIIEDVNKDVLIIRIGNAKIWVEHFSKWDYLSGDWVEMKGRYCGTIVLGDEYIQRFACDEIKIIDIKNIDR